MSTSASGVTAMRAVTISREYGSGGGEIAARLAQRLSWRLIDHEVVTQIAQRLGVEEEDAEAHDEYTEGWVLQFLSTMQTVGPMVALPSNLLFPPDDAAYSRALREVVNNAVSDSQCVIVGRGSQIILRERRDTLHVRIVAPLDLRVSYVARRENLSVVEARQRIQQKDQDRRRYLSMTYHRMPDDPHLYDLVLNTSVLDLDGCVSVIQLGLDAKAARLAVPADTLGPGAHMAPYAAQPEDFAVPIAPAANAPTDADSDESGA